MFKLLTWLTYVVDLVSAEIDDLRFRAEFGRVLPGGYNRRSRRDVWRTIKALRALERQGVYVMGATNRLRVKGSPLTYPITTGGVTAGSPAVVSATIATAICGVVESAKDANGNAVMYTEGVWSLSFTSVGAVAVGDPIYITAAAVLTQTAAGNKLFGNAMNAQGGAVTAALSIRLAGSN